MDAVLAEMTPDALAEVERYIGLFEQAGLSLDEWRRRVLAWQRFVLD